MAILAAFHTLDNAVARSHDTAGGERTHRHRNALDAARAETDETGAVSVDFLETEHYRAATKGQAHYAAVLEARAELQTIRNGDRRFSTCAARANAEANLTERLQALGIRVV